MGDTRPFRVRQPWVLYECDGRYVNVNNLVTQLAEPQLKQGRIGRIDRVNRLAAMQDGVTVNVTDSRETRHVVEARALVMAAGARNHGLVRSLAGGGLATGQQTIRAFMLVVQGAEGEDLSQGQLPHCAAFFESERVFVAPRRQDGRIIWLIGDGQRYLVEHPGDWLDLSARHWFHLLRTPLFELIPDLAKFADRFRWGYYEAVKAEGDHLGIVNK